VAVLVAGCAAPSPAHRTNRPPEYLERKQSQFEKAQAKGRPEADALGRQLSEALARTTELASLQAFCDSYPAARHTPEAQARIQQLLDQEKSVKQLLALAQKNASNGLQPRIYQRLGGLVATNQNTMALVRAVACPDPAVQKLAHERLSGLILSSQTAQPALQVPQLLAIAGAEELRGDPVSSNALEAATAIIQARFEPVDKEDYLRSLSSPEGGHLAATLVEAIKKTETKQYFFRTQTSGTNSTSLGVMPEGAAVHGFFSLNALSYDQWRYESLGIVREMVRRRFEAGNHDLFTEIYTLGEKYYRTSSTKPIGESPESFKDPLRHLGWFQGDD
jgi:hypothetical protein